MGVRRTIVRSAATALAAVTALALTGCVGSEATGTASAADAVGTWGDPADPPSLWLAADGSFGGDDGCNTLFGTWESQDDGTIEFGDIGSTRMFCEGVDVWLSEADSARIDGDTMTVFADGAIEIGTLERTSSTASAPESSAPPTDSAPPAANGFVGSWGTEAQSEPFLVIAADGTVSGSDGCNLLFGTWEPEGDGAIEFSDIGMTLMACEGVDTSFGQLDSATVDGDTLTVIDDHGTVLATLSRTG